MAGRRNSRPTKPRGATKAIRDRLHEAEATLEAIRSGQVDALVVSGPGGDRTLTIQGADHPYFVLLNAMKDGAALLEPGGGILFGNRSLGDIAGTPVTALSGVLFQRLVVPTERFQFEELLREGVRQNVTGEFTIATSAGRRRPATPVAIALSALPHASSSPRTGGDRSPRQPPVLMAIITDLTYRMATEAVRTRLLERLISAEDDERRRIARELHDETGQSLTALLVGLRAIEDMASAPEVRRVALRLRSIAGQTVDDVGRLARGLHPAVLDDMGLAAAVTRYTTDYARSFGTKLKCMVGDVDAPRLPALAAATMYRILQETLTNVARHARAKKISVTLTREASALALVVSDDGSGFDAARALKTTSGLGLNGIRERVTLLGGSIRIESTPGCGTVVSAHIPVAGPARSRRTAQAAGVTRQRSRS